jgi:hypothetical protein
MDKEVSISVLSASWCSTHGRHDFPLQYDLHREEKLCGSRNRNESATSSEGLSRRDGAQIYPLSPRLYASPIINTSENFRLLVIRIC